MACKCLNFLCLSAKFDPCGEGVELDLTASETGNWTGDIEFNGGYTDFSFAVIEGEKIVFPVELLNEYYTHVVRLYDSAGELVGDTCYQLEARAVKNAPSFPVLPASDVPEPIIITITEDGNSFTDPRLEGKKVAYIVTDDSSYTSTKWTKLQASDTLTSKNDGDGLPLLNFYENQIIVVNFLKT